MKKLSKLCRHIRRRIKRKYRIFKNSHRRKMTVAKHKLIMVKEKEFKYEQDYLITPKQAADFLMNVVKLHQEPEEVLVLICMDKKSNIIGFVEVARGDINSVGASIREIFKRVIINNTHQFILAHNHPTGDIEPSRGDKIHAMEVQRVSEILGVTFLDDLIIGDNSYYSFLEHNDLFPRYSFSGEVLYITDETLNELY